MKILERHRFVPGFFTVMRPSQLFCGTVKEREKVLVCMYLFTYLFRHHEKSKTDKYKL